MKIEKLSFMKSHPKISAFLETTRLLVAIALLFLAIRHAGISIVEAASEAIVWLADVSSKLDAVVIVALITGCVSIVGVIISSIVSKRIDYKRTRQEYLAKKREEPYGELVDMVYKLQQSTNGIIKYTEAEMSSDLAKFSKQITLWGSSDVVNKWVSFRENGMKPDKAKDNLFILEEIMNSMRKDLGLKKIKKGNLLAFFVNDIKQTMKKK